MSNKKLLIFGAAIVVFLGVLFFVFTRQQRTTPEEVMVGEEAVQQQKQQPANLAASLHVSEVPQMTFATYEASAETVSVPAKVKSYTFNTEFSLPFVSLIGQKLGLTESKQEEKTVLFYNSPESENPAYLKFDLGNGNYELNSYGTIALPQGAQVEGSVRDWLLSLGLIDETVACDITYQRNSIPGATFVECHRDWNNAGLPIINFIGLLNVPELQTINEIKVGMVDEYTPSEPDIVNVSTGADQNGRRRPDDYNTVTAVVDSNGNLMRLTSNLRMIEASVDFDQSDLYTPSEALNLFKSGSSTLSLVVPADQNVGWETVFPEKTAYGLKADVSDFVLTYIENPFGGKSLTPMYLARGTAVTPEGRKVKFIQAVPAGRNQQTFSGEVAGLMAAAVTPPDDEGLKLGPFNPEQRRIQIQTPPLQAGPCVPAAGQLSPILNLGEFGMLGLWTINAPSPEHNKEAGYEGPFMWYRSGQWYLVPPLGTPLPEINAVIAAYQTLNLPVRGQEVRDMDALQNEWAKYNFCPLRLSGGSPTLFVYGEGTYDVSVGRQVTYAYPGQNNGKWTVEEGQGSIYYEYKPVRFEKPVQGWIVGRSELPALAQRIGKELGLTSSETERLAFELNLAAYKVDSDKLFVGPIAQSEVDEKVALAVSPQVPVARYHFYVEASSGQ